MQISAHSTISIVLPGAGFSACSTPSDHLTKSQPLRAAPARDILLYNSGTWENCSPGQLIRCEVMGVYFCFGSRSVARRLVLEARPECPAGKRHEVFTPSLTGVADRMHLISPNVNLDTHITDVANVIQWEELSDVVLCGHSYGGCVISGVADRVPDRIDSLVYLDAFVLEDAKAFTIPSQPRLETDNWRLCGYLETAGRRPFQPKHST